MDINEKSPTGQGQGVYSGSELDKGTIKKQKFTTKKEHDSSGAKAFEPSDIPYKRVGCDYVKSIEKIDRYGIKKRQLIGWKKDTIKDDFDKDYLKLIPKYDFFYTQPDNLNYKPSHRNGYNLYYPFQHTEKKGEFTWSNILMEQIFGDQIELGYRLMQCYYLHPDRMMPILVLVSKLRSTGKSTFLNWLTMIFGDNTVMVNSEDLKSSFNALYATASWIFVEETLIEGNATVEKLKMMATAKTISINQKFVQQYQIPFYGKFILTSNHEDKFARIDQEEIRFFVRKLGTPKHINHNLEADLKNEIPAFLHYLSSLPPVDFSVGRVPFTVEELKNDSLEKVKSESRPGLFKDLKMRFEESFNNENAGKTFFYCTPLDIKERWYSHNYQTEPNYIRKILKDEFGLRTESMLKYNPFNIEYKQTNTGLSEFVPKVAGTPYKIERQLVEDETVKNVR